jgi:hypothetical protein
VLPPACPREWERRQFSRLSCRSVEILGLRGSAGVKRSGSALELYKQLQACETRVATRPASMQPLCPLTAVPASRACRPRNTTVLEPPHHMQEGGHTTTSSKPPVSTAASSRNLKNIVALWQAQNVACLHRSMTAVSAEMPQHHTTAASRPAQSRGGLESCLHKAQCHWFSVSHTSATNSTTYISGEARAAWPRRRQAAFATVAPPASGSGSTSA